jgi:hypothetical protein
MRQPLKLKRYITEAAACTPINPHRKKIQFDDTVGFI